MTTLCPRSAWIDRENLRNRIAKTGKDCAAVEGLIGSRHMYLTTDRVCRNRFPSWIDDPDSISDVHQKACPVATLY
jgi:hypothetical protein